MSHFSGLNEPLALMLDVFQQALVIVQIATEIRVLHMEGLGHPGLLGGPPRSPCYASEPTRGPTKKPMLCQPGGPPGGPAGSPCYARGACSYCFGLKMGSLAHSIRSGETISISMGRWKSQRTWFRIVKQLLLSSWHSLFQWWIVFA